MIPAVQSIMKDIPIGAILISKEKMVPKVLTKLILFLPNQLFFYKLPSNFQEHYVVLLDPMCGTGSTLLMAIR